MPRARRLATRIARAVAALHRARVIHRDIKPDNILLLKDGGLKLIDLGVARLPQLEDFPAEDIPGTPSYMAPELFSGAAGDEMTDLFALGVTIYRMFARSYPYGEIEPFMKPRFGRPASLAARRPDLPAWLDAAIARAIAVDPVAALWRRAGIRLRDREWRATRPPGRTRQDIALRQKSADVLAGAVRIACRAPGGRAGMEMTASASGRQLWAV